MKYLKMSIVLFLAMTMTHCKMGKPDNFDYGTIENNTYTNTFFAMSMELPEDWIINESEELTQMISEEMQDDPDLLAKMEVSKINTANLFSVFKFDPKTNTSQFNPNIILVAENVSMAIGVNDGSDYLKATKKMLEQTQSDYTYGDTGSETFGGQEFDFMNMTFNTAGTAVKQRFFSTVINDFSFNAVLSFVDGEQEKELLAIMETMDFE